MDLSEDVEIFRCEVEERVTELLPFFDVSRADPIARASEITIRNYSGLGIGYNVEQYYHEGVDIERAAVSIANKFVDASERILSKFYVPSEVVDNLSDFKKISHAIAISVVSVKDDEIQRDSKFIIKCEDIYLCLYIEYRISDTITVYVPVTKKIFESWRITVDKLMPSVTVSTARKYMLMFTDSTDEHDFYDHFTGFMYVYSGAPWGGSAALFYPEAMHIIAEEIDSNDIAVFPISPHTLLVASIDLSSCTDEQFDTDCRTLLEEYGKNDEWISSYVWIYNSVAEKVVLKNFRDSIA